MTEDDRPTEEVIYAALHVLGRKLDTVAGAIASVASGHTNLLDHLAGSEARRAHDFGEVSQRLEALERQVLQLGHRDTSEDLAHLTVAVEAATARLVSLSARVDELLDQPLAPGTPAPDAIDLTPIQDQIAGTAARHDQDLALALDVLARLAEAFDGLNARAVEPPDVRPILERIDQVAAALPTLASEVTGHTDVALVGVLRLVDQRLAALRASIADSLPPGEGTVGGFEAGAVMGATQAAWTRLDQRLDNEFDDLGRQLQGLASLIADVITVTEGLANRPVVTGDQFRKAASAVRDSVVSANRSRRERRGGPRGLDPG